LFSIACVRERERVRFAYRKAEGSSGLSAGVVEVKRNRSREASEGK